MTGATGETVAVVGGGIMGAGIAFVAAAAGQAVAIVETDDDAAAAARARFEQYARKAGTPEVARRVAVGTDLSTAVQGATVVVEAVVEDLAVKRRVFEALGAAARDDAVLASNTSGLPIEVLGAASGRPHQVLGLHFFNPVPAMRLVEVVTSADTAEATAARGEAWCASLGKQTVRVADRPGFVTTRLIALFMAEAIRSVEQGVATVVDVDQATRLAFNHPMGPLELADRVGLDTLLAILDDLTEAYGERFLAPPLLRQMVAAGKLGRKNARGFYEY